MLRNYFKIALRNLRKHKSVSFINIFGLAIGITCCMLVSLFILDELSYDRHNRDADRIYRVVKDFVTADGTKLPDATTPPAIAVAIQKDIPEIEHVTRLFPGWGGKFYVRFGDKRFIEENIYRADSSVFDVFTLPFVQGNAQTALASPDAIVLTASMAKKYFGTEDPMGKTLLIDNRPPKRVTAVLKDIPANSHFKLDFLTPVRFGNNGQPANIDNNWNRYNYYTYMKLKPGADIAAVDEKIRATFKKNKPEDLNYFYSQPLTGIHLTSNLKWELSPNSDKIYIYVFGTIALFILIIACINYINLTTARSTLRAKEIGVRKVSGAFKASLIRQFLTESVVFAIIASLLAFGMAYLLLPSINSITGKNLSLVPQGNYLLPVAVLAFAIVIGLIAGLYPALYLSSFEPVKVLKGEKLAGAAGGFSLRKVLVVTQFVISISLIIGSIIVLQQINFIQRAKLGLDKDHVLMLNDVGFLNRSDRQALKNELLKIPGIKKIGASDGVVGGQNSTNGLRAIGAQSSQVVNFINIDYDFLDALNMQVKEGRGFSPNHLSDTADGIILNETAVKQMGVPSPVIGQQIVWSDSVNVKVVGVVKDFHFASLKNEIKPFAFVTNMNRQGFFVIKLDGANMQSTIQKIKARWDRTVTSRPFQYFFLDETYAKLYASEQHFKSIFFYITGIAIFISCLGLFGLSSFITEQRTKEIGIRKVLGASVTGIVRLLSKDFVLLVVIAAVIAFPLSWWAMTQWLQDFAYRISISWWVFVVAGIAALLIALLTISFQAVKAAMSNPVKSLRSE